MGNFLPIGVIKFHGQAELLGFFDFLDHALGQFVTEDPDLFALLHEILSPAHAGDSSAPAFLREDPGEIYVRCDGQLAVDVSHPAVADRVLQVLLRVPLVRRTNENIIHFQFPFPAICGMMTVSDGTIHNFLFCQVEQL